MALASTAVGTNGLCQSLELTLVPLDSVTADAMLDAVQSDLFAPTAKIVAEEAEMLNERLWHFTDHESFVRDREALHRRGQSASAQRSAVNWCLGTHPGAEAAPVD